MGFIAPLFLLGIAAIALPIWLHRLRTQSSERKPFGSTMLLEPAEERVHVRKRLKYLSLLALRTGLLVLLALAFAKPFLDSEDAAAPDGAAGTHLVVVDTSASMAREGVFDAARAQARDALDSAPAGALLQLFAAAETLRPLSSPAEESAAHRAALERLAAGSGRSDFGEMLAAADALARDMPGPVTVHLVSDFQQSAMPARFADLGTRHVARFVPHRVGGEEADNGRIDVLREQDGVVEVVTTGAEGRQVVLQLNGEVVGRSGVPPGARQAVTFADIEGAQGENRLEATLAGSDAFAADDRRFAVFSRGNLRPVPVITQDLRALPYTYLSAALEAAGEGGFSAEPMPVADLDPRVLARYRFAIVDDIGAIGPSLEEPLRAWVEQGGALLAFAGSSTAGRASLPVTGHEVPPAGLGARSSAQLRVVSLDEKHPVLAGTDGWFAPSFGAVTPAVPKSGDDVIASLEDATPLLIESRIGAGKVLLVTAGLENVTNDLPVRPVFVGFLLEAARYLSGTSGLVREFGAGESLRLPGAGGQVLDPDGEALLSLQGTTAGGSVTLGAPGIYTVLAPGLEYAVAVNVDPRESQFAAVPDTVLEDWAALSGTQAATSGQDRTASSQAGRIDLWGWALIGLVLFVIAESVVGNWFLSPAARRPRGETQ